MTLTIYDPNTAFRNQVLEQNGRILEFSEKCLEKVDEIVEENIGLRNRVQDWNQRSIFFNITGVAVSVLTALGSLISHLTSGTLFSAVVLSSSLSAAVILATSLFLSICIMKKL